MPLTVKSISLWRKEVENKTGVLAQTLEPFAKAGADFSVVMGYRYAGNDTQAAIELYPVSGKKVTAAAAGAGLAASSIPTLLVEGDDKPGLGLLIAEAIAGGWSQHDVLCRSGDRAKILGGTRVRDGSRREDSGSAHQEGGGEQEEVKGNEYLPGMQK